MSAIFDLQTVLNFRLRQHGLDGNTSFSVEEVVRKTGGLQAQLQSAAQLQIWTRNHETTKAAIERALWQDRRIVKTSAMRQTLHLLPAEDYALYIAALRKSRSDALHKIMAKFDITPKQLADLHDSITAALQDGPQTAALLFAAIRARASTAIRDYLAKAWSIQLFRLAMIEGLICCGPDHGNQSTFVLSEHWLPGQRTVREDAAQRWLLQRYLHSYGPATIADFRRWAGFPAAEAKRIWRENSDLHHSVQTESGPAQILKQDTESFFTPSYAKNDLQLLPYFDPYLLGHDNKNQYIDARFVQQVYRKAGWITPVLLESGRVIGVWSAKKSGKSTVIIAEPFGQLSTRLSAELERKVSLMQVFLNSKCSLVLR